MTIPKVFSIKTFMSIVLISQRPSFSLNVVSSAYFCKCLTETEWEMPIMLLLSTDNTFSIVLVDHYHLWHNFPRYDVHYHARNRAYLPVIKSEFICVNGRIFLNILRKPIEKSVCFCVINNLSDYTAAFLSTRHKTGVLPAAPRHTWDFLLECLKHPVFHKQICKLPKSIYWEEHKNY